MSKNHTYESMQHRIRKFGLDPVWDVAFEMTGLDKGLFASRDPHVLIVGIIYYKLDIPYGEKSRVQNRLMEEFGVSSQPTITGTAREVEENRLMWDRSEVGKDKKNRFTKNMTYVRMLVESTDDGPDWHDFQSTFFAEEDGIETFTPA